MNLKNKPENLKESLDKVPEGSRKYAGTIVLIVIIAACVVGILIGRSIDARNKETEETFAAPLFEHALPEGARLVQKTSSHSARDGSTYACLIIQTEASEKELKSFYSDLQLEPAEKGDGVVFYIREVDEDGLSQLRKADLYEEEGGDYWYIYAYSGDDVDE